MEKRGYKGNDGKCCWDTELEEKEGGRKEGMAELREMTALMMAKRQVRVQCNGHCMELFPEDI